jgi:chromosome segregation ATPase
MHTKEQLMEMHTEHNEWQNKIKFYRGELKKLNEQLDEIVSRKPSSRVMASIEHFQNQFTIQNEVLDIMRHDFKQHENAIEAKHNSLNSNDPGLIENHESHRERLAQFEKLFHDLRDEFHEFNQKELQQQY